MRPWAKKEKLLNTKKHNHVVISEPVTRHTLGPFPLWCFIIYLFFKMLFCVWMDGYTCATVPVWKLKDGVSIWALSSLKCALGITYKIIRLGGKAPLPTLWAILLALSNFYLFTLRDRVLCNPAGQEFCVAKDDFGLLTSLVLGNRHGSPCPVLTGFLGYCITTGSQEVCVGSHSCLSLLMKIEITMLLSSKCDVLRTILFPFWGGTVVPSQ